MTAAWTTAYLAGLTDPTEPTTFAAPSRVFSAQTVRQAVRLRRGGSAVRLVLSNEFGAAPLVIDEITVSDGRSVHPAPWHGAARWEIPPGATATGDPVPLSIAAGEELLVSCFIAGHTGLATYLHDAQRTGEVAPGNQLGRRQLTDPEQFTSLYWITQIQVDTAAQPPVIVAFGDSITRGSGSTTDQEQRYPDHLQRRLLAAGVDGAVVLNAGIGGNRLFTPTIGPSMIDRFARDVLSVAETTHVVIMGGLNDLGSPSGAGSPRPTEGELIDGLFGLARRAAEHGIRPALGTITPAGGSSYDSFRAESVAKTRRAVNHAIMTQPDWPVVDFATGVADPGDPSRLAARYDAGDGVHPGDLGNRALADAVDLAIFG